MRIPVNPWHLAFTAAFFLLFSTFTSSPEETLTVLVVSYPFGRYSALVFKHYFFKKAVAFDMGGVVTQGDFYTEILTEMPGTRRLIERLKVNYKVALLSNNNAEGFVPFDRKFRLSHLFDEVIVSGREGVKKPDPRIFDITLKRLRVKASDLYFLDDTPENAEAAKKLGIRGIVFKDAKQAEEALKAAGLRF